LRGRKKGSENQRVDRQSLVLVYNHPDLALLLSAYIHNDAHGLPPLYNYFGPP
jgi:hypothetical protein